MSVPYPSFLRGILLLALTLAGSSALASPPGPAFSAPQSQNGRLAVHKAMQILTAQGAAHGLDPQLIQALSKAQGRMTATPRPGKALEGQRARRPSDISHEALLQAMLQLMTQKRLEQIPRLTRLALSKFCQKPVGKLLKPKVQVTLLKQLRDAMGEKTFKRVVGQRIAADKRALAAMKNQAQPGEAADSADMCRGYGFSLLPENDAAFYDPEYLANMLMESGQSAGGSHFVHSQPSKALEVFEQAWRKLTPANVGLPWQYALTGSAANNLLYDIARIAAEDRLGKKVRHAEILYFDGVYGGGSGQINGMNTVRTVGMDSAPDLSAFKIPSPHKPVGKELGEAELQQLKRVEDEALAQIVTKVKTSETPVAGLLMEALLGPKGGYDYRPEFMLRLRQTCDALGIPIFDDEVLTGGGRTGSLFAYQRYEGFEPDFITFGKGLQVAGVVAVHRNRAVPFRLPWVENTIKQYSEPLLKSAQILNAIHERGLLDNVRQTGPYLLRSLQTHWQEPAGEPVRGQGLLLTFSKYPIGLGVAHNRIMPHLALSTKDVDRLVGPPMAPLQKLKRDLRRHRKELTRLYRAHLQTGRPLQKNYQLVDLLSGARKAAEAAVARTEPDPELRAAQRIARDLQAQIRAIEQEQAR